MDRAWGLLLELSARARRGERLPAPPLDELSDSERRFFDLYRPMIDGPIAVGQLGQSLDGCIATAQGQSHYVTGPESIAHLHRLRALADAVIVASGTAEADDPRLTTRAVEGPSPLRVVLDRQARLPETLKAYRQEGPCLRVTAVEEPPDIAGVETLRLPADAEGFDPHRVKAALSARGATRLLVEGGGKLVSSWYRAGALDRLHLVVAPILLGAGRRGLDLPPARDLASLARPPARHYDLGADVLFDLDLTA